MSDVVFTVKSELPDMISTLKEIYPDKWKQILSKATTETAYYVLNKYKQQLPRYLDRPTKFTVNSMYVKPAKPTEIEASVQWKTDVLGRGAGDYLQPEVYGGTRRDKGFERALQYKGLMPVGYYAIPTDDVELDAFGNVSRGLFVKIISALQASFDTSQNRTRQKGYKGKSDGFITKYRGGMVDKARAQAADKRAQAKATKYFVVQPRSAGGLFPGIYESRVLFGGRGSRRLFSFISKASVDYKAIFPFEQIGKDAAAAKFEAKLEEAIDQVVK